MANQNKNLSVLSETEIFAYYGLPDFDEEQRCRFLNLSAPELVLAQSRPNINAQAYCALQIGYFKAKRFFFRFEWADVEADKNFIIENYFSSFDVNDTKEISNKEYYKQRKLIAEFCDYTLWSTDHKPALFELAKQVARRDVTPSYISIELLSWLNDIAVIRPAYTTLQFIVIEALSFERSRLGSFIGETLTTAQKLMLEELLIHDDSLSNLAVLKQDAKSFKWKQMSLEREKRSILKPIYKLSKVILPKLDISLQNQLYYSNLAIFYTIYDLRRLPKGQSFLYLLCYSFYRFRQLTDNLVDSMKFHLKKLETANKTSANIKFNKLTANARKKAPLVGKLLLLYVDEKFTDITPFGEVRRQAFNILSKEELQEAGNSMLDKSVTRLSLRWQLVSEISKLVTYHLRPIFNAISFESSIPNNPWIKALNWVNETHNKKQTLSNRSIAECPPETLPKRLQHFLCLFDEEYQPVSVYSDRYEFWLYRQIRKRLQAGELYIDDSMQYRRLNDELVSVDEKASILKQMKIPWLQRPIESQLYVLGTELDELWRVFNKELKAGNLKHLDYDSKKQKFVWHRNPAKEPPTLDTIFYDQIPYCDVTEVFRFVNDKCQFLFSLKPLQPRYAKKPANLDDLMAVIIAQAMNHGNKVMSQTSDIPYHMLTATYDQYLRQASLQAANDTVSNAIMELPIFQHFSLDLDALYGAVDGQKFTVKHSNIKARHSRKYFGKGTGVVAYTLLCNHIPLQGYLIGAHEYEAHHVFDIWYRNTSDINPSVITGDMHSINKANFAILHWFGLSFSPRFTSLNKQLADIYCFSRVENFKEQMIKPTRQIDCDLIVREKDTIDQIVATLGLKEMTQGVLIRKLCTYTAANPTRQAIFEYDKLIRSIYTLKYLLNPDIEQIVNHSQNRLEAYHQLRAAIAKIGGKKELTGHTDIELEISNQCARLMANVIIYYNSTLLSHLLEKFEMQGNENAVELIKSTSPIAWRHLLLNGHYTFHSDAPLIDIDSIIDRIEID